MYCHFGLWDRSPKCNIRFCVARILYTVFFYLSTQMRKISFFTFFMNFHFFQWKFTLRVKIHFFSENSLLGWKFSRAVWESDFCENAQFWVGIFVSLIQETTKMKNAGKNLSFLLTKCGFWYIIGVVSTG